MNAGWEKFPILKGYHLVTFLKIGIYKNILACSGDGKFSHRLHLLGNCNRKLFCHVSQVDNVNLTKTLNSSIANNSQECCSTD